jgi:leucine-rich repeat-containing protein 49
VPLLEGEEKLKMITFQHNKIYKIENLISLPNLLYIDLYDNVIKEMENLALPTLKVLLLPKNQISKIRGIN